MAFDFGAGVAAAGESVAKVAGTAALENIKSDLEKEKITLANDLTTKRESIGRAEENTYKLGQMDVSNKFQAGENDKTRTSHEKVAQIGANATLGAAATTSSAHERATKYTADKHLETEMKRAETLLEVARIQTGSKEKIADIISTARAKAREVSLLSDDAIEAAAWTKISTGVSPNTGYGGRADKAAVDNMVQKIAKENGWSPQDLINQKGNSVAAQKALEKNVAQTAAIAAFSSTADKVGKIVLETAEDGGADPSGIKLFNRWIQGGRKDIVGDKAVSEFNAALVTWRQETAKILSGSMGNTPASDAKSAEIADMINKADTLDTIKGIVHVFTLERKDRLAGLAETRKDLSNTIQGSTLPGREKPPTELPAHTKANPEGLPALPVKNGAVDVDVMKANPGKPYNSPRGPVTWDPTANEVIFYKSPGQQ